ncbi:hypothetical protein [Flammeovirga sp. SubArs3]|uniref:hypothetical protein n=1 Tax=Flammeovirga sp. SubArs3 TaxID=2995316 RepID=UPI00248AD318|nr:hypothetical protein [Flammeovirga sp. SubArs3]
MKTNLTILFLLLMNICIAQMIEDEQLLSKVFSDEQLELMSQREIDYWLELFHHPKNINKLSLSDAQVILALTYDEVEVLTNYRKKFGKFVLVDEIDRLNWSIQTKERVKKAIYVAKIDESNMSVKQRWLSPDQHYLMLNTTMKYPLSKGFTENYYQGVPLSSQLRFKWKKRNDYSFALNLDHNEGEIWFWNHKQRSYGVSHASGHISLYNKGIFSKICLGDYQMISGQGLVFGGGYFLGKGSDPILSVIRGQDGIREYASMSNAGFMRGVATSIKITKNLSTDLFLSSKRLNVNFKDKDFTINNSLVLYDSTLIGRKNNLSETLIGGRLGWKNETFSTHLNFMQVNYSTPKQDLNHDIKLSAETQSIRNMSLDMSYRWKNLYFISEVANDLNNNYAISTSLFIGLLKGVDWSVLYRDYDVAYQAPYSYSVSEGSQVSNEQGFYMGFKVNPNKKLNMTFFFDVFKFPSSTYLNNGGREGNEWKLNTSYVLKKGQQIHFVCSYKEKGRYYANDSSRVKQYTQEHWVKYSLKYSLAVAKFLNWSVRGLVTQYQLDQWKTGYMFLQDVGYNNPMKWSVFTRIAMFYSPSYETRLYAYEKNLRYSYSFPPYYGIGWKSYILMKYKFGRGNSIQVRWAYTVFNDRQSVVSTWNSRNGNTIQEVGVQLFLKI